MGRKAVQAAITEAGLPSVHMAWREGYAPPLPWCAFYLDDTYGKYADNTTIVPALKWVIELYQASSDEEVEAALEASIEKSFGPFSKSESWIESENSIQTAYYFKEIDNG